MLSRIWYLVLAIAIALAGAFAFILVDELNEQRSRAADRSLVRDLRELDMALALEAHRRASAIAGLAVNSDLRAALITQASGRPIDRGGLEHALKNLDAQLGEGAADRLLALSIDGTIVAELGAEGRAPEGAGLGAFPFVRDALRGYITDDVMLYDGEVYRFVARPVVDQGRYLGAVVHGKKIDERFAAQLSRLLPETAIAFYRGDEILGSNIPGALRIKGDAFGRAIGERGVRIEERASAPFESGDGEQAILAALIGSAASADVGVALIRQVNAVGSPLELLPKISDDAMASLPLPLLAGCALILALLGFVFYSLDAVRPRKRFAHAAANLAADGGSRLKISEMPRAYRAIAGAINEALEAQASRSGGKAAEISGLLESEDGAEESRSSYFGFSSDAPPPSEEAEAAAAAPLPPSPALPASELSDAQEPQEAQEAQEAQETQTRDEASADPFGSAAPTGDEHDRETLSPDEVEELRDAFEPAAREEPASASGDDPFGAPIPPAAPAAPPAPPAPPPAPPAAATAEEDPFAATASAPAPSEAPPTPLAPQPSPDSPPPSIPGAPRVPAFDPHGFDDDEGATTVAEIPKELIAQFQKPEPEPEPEDPELVHFKEVFEEYIAMRESLGEPTAGLTFERFEVTLRKNRDAIVERHGVSTVRFTVYNKDGKAALRATPVK